MRRLLAGLVLAVAGCGGDAPTRPQSPTPPPPVPVPVAVAATGGDGQTGTVGAPLAEPLRVRVTDARGAGVAGVLVDWRTTGGIPTSPTSATDADGNATAQWTLGTVAGGQDLSAAARGIATSVAFRAMAAPGPIATVRIAPAAPAPLRPLQQTTLRVAAADTYGNTVAAPTVAWSIGGSSATSVARVDSAGVVTALARGTAYVAATAGVARDSVLLEVIGADPIVWASLTVGNYHTCGLSVDGVAYCWGQNDNGELGDGTTVARATPTRVAAEFKFAALAAAWTHTCGLATTGAAYCWGENVDNVLGTAAASGSTVPAPVVGGHSFVSVATGIASTCGLDRSGTVYCWGRNELGELGSGPGAGGATPRAAFGGPYTALDVGTSHACAIAATGQSYCWGYNRIGQLGVGLDTLVFSTTPRAVGALGEYTQLRAGGSHSCALDRAGVAWCWGSNYQGQGGRSPVGTSGTAPELVTTALRFIAVDAGFSESCGLTTAGDGWCWGALSDFQYGQLGAGVLAGSLAPTGIKADAPLASLAMNDQRWHHCAVTRLGVALCWGSNWRGQLGDGTRLDRSAPVRVAEPEEP